MTRLIVMVLLLVLSVAVLGQAPTAIVTAVHGRYTTTEYGDQIIVSDNEARAANGERWLWTSVGGTVNGIGMAASSLPLFQVGDTVTRQDGNVRGGQSAFVSLGHTWPAGTVLYHVNPISTQLTAEAWEAAVVRSAAPWNAVLSAITLGVSVDTGVTTAQRDGINAIFTRVDPSVWTGVTYWWWGGSGELIDADIILNERYLWSVHPDPCREFFVENTITHEFGHLLGLDHSADPEATMWPYTSGCETIREDLAADDIAGLLSLYPGGAPPPPPSAEICGDGIDNDGDGLIDEGCTSGPPVCKKHGRWAC